MATDREREVGKTMAERKGTRNKVSLGFFFFFYKINEERTLIFVSNGIAHKC